MERTTKQIIPARDWWAVMFKPEPPYFWLDAIAFWALEEVTDEGGTIEEVRGYVGGDFLMPPDNQEEFYIYAFGGDIGDDTRQQWSQEGLKLAEKRAAASGQAT